MQKLSDDSEKLVNLIIKLEINFKYFKNFLILQKKKC